MEALEALEGQDGKIHALLDVFPQLVWTATPNGALDYVNAPFYSYTGWQPNKALGKEWISVVHEDDHAISIERWNYSLQTGKPYEVEHRIKRISDGSFIWHLVKAVAVKNEQGEIIKWLGTSVDVHAQKQIEEQLSRFVYIASHDLKSPVNNMKALVELFKIQRKENWDKLVDLLEISTVKLDDTLKNIVARVKVNPQQEQAREINLNALLQELLDKGIQEELDRIGASLNADFSQCSNLYYIESYLKLIFQTMISNAIKYRDPNRKLVIKIGSSRKEGFVLLHFDDNGSGIDLQKYADVIFNPYSQLHDDKSGKGMGLYLTKNMIVKNGGWVDIKSQPDIGTSFQLYLKEYTP